MQGGSGGLGGSGGAGGGASASPPATNLEVWLKGDAGVTLEAGKVALWADQSGKHHDFAQPDVALRPAVVNGALLFTGVEHLVAAETQLFTTPSSALTIAVVFTSSSVAGQKFLFNYGTDDNHNGNTNLELGYSTGAQTLGNFGLHRGTYNATLAPGGTIVENQKVRAVVTLSATGAPPANVSVRLDGVEIPTANDGAGFLAPSTYVAAAVPMEVGGRVDGNHTAATLAAHLASPGDAHHVGTIAEVLVYKGGLAEGDLPLLETYLQTR